MTNEELKQYLEDFISDTFNIDKPVSNLDIFNSLQAMDKERYLLKTRIQNILLNTNKECENCDIKRTLMSQIKEFDKNAYPNFNRRSED